MSAPQLVALSIADDPAAWRGIGFALDAGGSGVVGGVRIDVGAAPGAGIVGWTLTADPPASLDGLPTAAAPSGVQPRFPPPAHPNGAVALDHVVVLSPALERTLTAFAAAGLSARRVTRPAGAHGRRQAFFVLGPALAEVVGDAGGAGPARFWGLAFAVADLDAAATLLGGALGDPQDAVQPGRRIATIRREAGLAVPVAFMTPRNSG